MSNIEYVEVHATQTPIGTSSDKSIVATIEVPFFIYIMIVMIIALAFTIIFNTKKWN